MSKILEIPTSPTAQTFQIALGDVLYQVTLRWIGAQGAWNLDLGDANGVPVLCGLPVLPGVDLLAQYAYLGIGGSIVVSNDPDPGNPPTYEGLGGDGRIYYVVAS